MDERIRFIAKYLEGESMAATCRAFGVSRETGYKWLSRFEEGGIEGLGDRSRAPHCHPNATEPEVVRLLLSSRAEHPTWGPRKLLAWLAPRHPKLVLPSPSTAGDVLKRHGLVVPRRTRRRAWATGTAPGAPDGCNLVWATDFKGQFRLGDRTMCYPLTIQDGYSRMLLRCQGLRTPAYDVAKPVFEAAFREYGLPRSMRSDNGSPFAAACFSGLTKLSVWWIKLGIELQRIVPGHPEQNGRLERLHRTLKDETARPPRRSLRGQQEAFNAFRREYNEDRPHEALEQKVPARFYQASGCRFPERLKKPEYDGHVEVRRLNANGEANFRGFRFTVGKALEEEDIAFEPVDDGLWRLHFYKTSLGMFNEGKGILTRPGCTRKATPVRSRQVRQ